MKTLMTTGFALILMIAPAMAQTAAPAQAVAPVNSAAPHTHEGVFEKADANHDGIVTKEEFLASEGQYFDSVDTNHDGKLSKEEIQAQRQKARAERAQWHATSK